MSDVTKPPIPDPVPRPTRPDRAREVWVATWHHGWVCNPTPEQMIHDEDPEEAA